MPQLFDPWDVDPFVADMNACRALLRGGSKSFDLAARLLPRAVRNPAVALYAFCREADDVIDEGGGGLGWLRERLTLVYEGRPLALPTDRALAHVVASFAIPRELPDALLEGFAWDVDGRRYQDLFELRAYAARVAGSVGAMMAVVMGVRDSERLAAAVELGVAMQLSNIARDVGEDARNGRIYLPLDWVAEAGIDPEALVANPIHSPTLGRVVAQLLEAAKQHYQQASAGIARLPIGCRFGIGTAALLYAEIGREVGRRNMDAVSGRAVVPVGRKVSALATGLAGMTLPLRAMSGNCMPEGAFLVDAVVSTAPRVASTDSPAPWWDIRLRSTLELFERLEDRQRVRP
jgi:phytoene synthase